MAINKKLIHFENFENFNSKKLSANKENTKYTIGISGEVINGTDIDILYQSIVYIKDTQQQWTHGTLYSTVNWSVLEDPFNGYEYVDLGLPSGTLWAKCNIGAEKESDYGLYFAWGEVDGYKDASSGKSFSPDDYKFKNGDACDGKFTKYDSSDNLTTLLLEDDAAGVNMGGSWHMPSKEQCEELINSSYTTITWTTVNGINGRLITSKTNNNTLFLPASGGCLWGSVGSVGSGGYYWSSSLGEDDPYGAWYLGFGSGGISVGNDGRCCGLSVRGVITKTT